MSHDPLLDRIREVRSLLTTFRSTLTSQKRFTDETASIFSTEDNEFWAFQEEHARIKHSGIPPVKRARLMKLLAQKAVQWSRLCKLAKSGAPIPNDFMNADKTST